MNAVIETKFAKLLSYGAALTTVLVIAGPVSDPVNVTKLFTIGVLAFGLIPFFFYLGKAQLLKKNLIPTLLSAIFILFSINSVLFSASPLTQNIYGTTGRNTGLIAMISFAILFLVSSNISSKRNIDFLLNWFLIAGVINIGYGVVVQFFGDPIPWNNIYGTLLGTFGNPNFSGAFYGLLTGAFLAMAFSRTDSRKIQFVNLGLSLASGFCVLFTKTTQGMLVAGLTSGVVILFFLAKKIKIKVLTFSYLIVFLTVGFFVLIGILQKGPLSSLLYKRSVSLRGVYWDAAVSTGNTHPWSGVGLDSFGNWYRRERSEKAATWLPGPETITNAAHNYFLDMYANGGLPLLISYSSFTILGLFSAYKIVKKMAGFDSTAIILIVVYIGFLAQSLISISQIGLALWGWILSGLLYSYSRIIHENQNFSHQKIRQIKKASIESPLGVFVFSCMSLGVIISVPPLSADIKYMSAMKSSQLSNIQSALTPSYFNPQFIERIAMTAYTLEQNKLYEEAHKYALIGVRFNPESFDAWKLLFIIKNSTSEERDWALQNMKKLDPLNRNLMQIK